MKTKFIVFLFLLLLYGCIKPNDSENPFGTVSPQDQAVVVNEFNASGNDWIEVYNKSNVAVDLGGFKLIDNGTNNTPLIINPGTIILPDSFVVFENLPFGLSASESDGVNLFNLSGILIDSYTYPAGSITPGKTVGRLPDGNQWAFNLTPTKGYSNSSNPPPPDTSQKLFINEFMANPPAGESDWIEIFNKDSVNPINLAGYILKDSLNAGTSWTIPSGFVIQPRGFLAFTQGIHFPFGLSSQTDGIKLFTPEGRLVDSYFYNTPQIQNRTTGRLPDGGTWTPNLTPTKGGPNSP